MKEFTFSNLTSHLSSSFNNLYKFSNSTFKVSKEFSLYLVNLTNSSIKDSTKKIISSSPSSSSSDLNLMS